MNRSSSRLLIGAAVPVALLIGATTAGIAHQSKSGSGAITIGASSTASTSAQLVNTGLCDVPGISAACPPPSAATGATSEPVPARVFPGPARTSLCDVPGLAVECPAP